MKKSLKGIKKDHNRERKAPGNRMGHGNTAPYSILKNKAQGTVTSSEVPDLTSVISILEDVPSNNVDAKVEAKVEERKDDGQEQESKEGLGERSCKRARRSKPRK